MSNYKNFDPDLDPTQPSPPPPQNAPQSNPATEQQTSPPPNPNHRLPNSNNWQHGDHKTDLDSQEYVIEEYLGSGGFAITYLATELISNQKVVLKVLKDDLKKRPDFRIISNSFINEALRLKACQSPFIVTVDKVTEIDHKQVIVMEYIEGQTLGDKVREMGGQLPVNLAVKYIKQVGEALKKVHSQNLLHRDIKPDNIIIRARNDEAILIDFGLALKFDPNNVAANRQWFTPGYAPIEQYQQQVKWGFYTDVYSLAATLYYSLTGETPIHPEDRLSGIRLNSPKRLNPNIPETVNAAIIEGLKVSPDARPQTVEAWLKLFDTSPSFTILKENSKLILIFSLSILGSAVLFLVLRKPCDSVFAPVFSSINVCGEPMDNWKNYESTEYEFRLKYPTNWKLEPVPKNVLQPWELRFYAPNRPEPILIIIVEELQPLYSLNEYWKDVIKPRLKNSHLTNIKIEGDAQLTKLKVDSDKKEHSALTFDYSYEQGNNFVKSREIITVYNYHGYTILFKGDEQAFKEYQEQVDNIIQSFEFIIPE